jgi:hypothetical protein
MGIRTEISRLAGLASIVGQGFYGMKEPLPVDLKWIIVPNQRGAF